MNNTWASLSLDAQLAALLQENNIVTPTQVQAEAIPVMLEGKDVIAHSQTGSGKTLAYLLPVLQRIDSEDKNVQAVVLAPTQELAMQIVQVAKSYGEPIGVRIQALIGGAAIKRQIEKLKEHPQLVIGTPGRIRELLMQRKLKLHETRTIVVDEVDQVFGLGSTSEVEEVLQSTKRDRQVAFFSATFPEAMEELERRWLNEPVRVAVTPQQRVAASVEHQFIVCDKRDKVDTARRIVRLLNPAAALLFLNDTDVISNWESKLSYEGFTVEAIYGDADKAKRASTLARFRDGRCQLLLATDVAARGLDIADLPLVINLDPPFDADHYVHRAGRTGRMGRFGTVISIVTPQELFIMDKFQKQLAITITQKVLDRGKLVNADEARQKAAPFRRASGSRQAEQAPGQTAGAGKESMQGTARTTASKADAKPASKRPPQKTATKSVRERDRKDKGAPKWLKAKRSEND
ncbi:DEAD/DEAH box helicase [Paenibacillus abyssi]|nr:DEAD/DEAH box helicase [Paenibacillus abyssi]